MDNMPKDITVDYPATTAEYSEKSKELDPDWAGAIMNMKVKEMGADYFAELFEPAVEAATKNNAPLYCGEYGVIDRVAPEEALLWFEAFHKSLKNAGIGSAVWSYRRMDFGLSDARMDGVRDRVLKLIKGE